MSRVAGGGNMQGLIGIEHGTTGYSKRKNFDDVPLDFKLPPGNVERGRKYFKKHCVSCHSVYPDGSTFAAGHSHGPTMFDVYMRTSGVEETGRASSIECTNTGFGMRGLEPGFTVWTPAELMNYMKNPRLAMGQNQMNFEGITDFQTRVDIIHYLKTLTWANPAFHEIVEKPHWFGPMRVYQGWKNDREGKKQKHRPVGIP